MKEARVGVRVSLGDRKVTVLMPEKSGARPEYVLMELRRPATCDEIEEALTPGGLSRVSEEKIEEDGRRLIRIGLSYEGAVVLQQALKDALAPFRAARKNISPQLASERLR